MRYLVIALALAVMALATMTVLDRRSGKKTVRGVDEPADQGNIEAPTAARSLAEIMADVVGRLVTEEPDDGFRARALEDLSKATARDASDAEVIRPSLASTLDEIIAAAATHRPSGDSATVTASSRRLAVLRVSRDFTALLEARLDAARNDAELVHEGKVLPAVSLVSAPRRAGHEPVGWDRLGAFSHTAGDPLPEDVSRLDDREVTLVGYVLAGDSAATLTEFLLVESSWTCCFGPPPAVTRVVAVRMADDAVPPPAPNVAVALHGIFSVGEEREDGHVTGVYRLIAREVSTLD